MKKAIMTEQQIDWPHTFTNLCTGMKERYEMRNIDTVFQCWSEEFGEVEIRIKSDNVVGYYPFKYGDEYEINLEIAHKPKPEGKTYTL